MSFYTLDRSRRYSVGDYGCPQVSPMNVSIGSPTYRVYWGDQPSGSLSSLTSSNGSFPLIAQHGTAIKNNVGMRFNGNVSFLGNFPLTTPNYSIYVVFAPMTVNNSFQSIFTIGSGEGYFLENMKFIHYTGAILSNTLTVGEVQGFIMNATGANNTVTTYQNTVPLAPTFNAGTTTKIYTNVGGDLSNEDFNGYYGELNVWMGRNLTYGDIQSLNRYQKNNYPISYT